MWSASTSPELLHDLELQYRPVAESRDPDFRVHVRGLTLTDPIRVRRMIGNLLANAIKYTAEGGALLAARQTRDGLRVEVRTPASASRPSGLRDVFLEFYKVADHAGTSDGFGLGLAIVARLSHAAGPSRQRAFAPGERQRVPRRAARRRRGSGASPRERPRAAESSS